MSLKSLIRGWLDIPEVRTATVGPDDNPGYPEIAIMFDNTPPEVVREVERQEDLVVNAMAGAMALAGAGGIHERTTRNKRQRLDREPVVVDPTDISALLGSLRGN